MSALCGLEGTFRWTGPITQVEIVVDTLVEGGLGAGVITEALLRSEADSTLLIAAEAYSRDEWHLYDESVVAVSGLAVLGRDVGDTGWLTKEENPRWGVA